MTSDEAISAHLEWKNRFRIGLAGREMLDVAKISADCCCLFGIWLHGEAKTSLGEDAQYATCVAHHAVFHLEAGKIAEKVNQREFLAVEGMMSRYSDYAKASETLVLSVRELFRGRDGNSA